MAKVYRWCFQTDALQCTCGGLQETRWKVNNINNKCMSAHGYWTSSLPFLHLLLRKCCGKKQDHRSNTVDQMNRKRLCRHSALMLMISTKKSTFCRFPYQMLMSLFCCLMCLRGTEACRKFNMNMIDMFWLWHGKIENCNSKTTVRVVVVLEPLARMVECGNRCYKRWTSGSGPLPLGQVMLLLHTIDGHMYQ